MSEQEEEHQTVKTKIAPPPGRGLIPFSIGQSVGRVQTVPTLPNSQAVYNGSHDPVTLAFQDNFKQCGIAPQSSFTVASPANLKQSGRIWSNLTNHN